MVYCVKFNPEIRYTYNELNAVLPPPPPKPPKEWITDTILDFKDKDDKKAVLAYVRSKLEIAYEKPNKIVCHCIFPEKHSNGDNVPSAVLFKDKSPRFYCSGCGSYYFVDELAELLDWSDLKELLKKTVSKSKGRSDVMEPLTIERFITSLIDTSSVRMDG